MYVHKRLKKTKPLHAWSTMPCRCNWYYPAMLNLNEKKWRQGFVTGNGPDSCGNHIILMKTAPNSKTNTKPTIQSECQYAKNKVK